MKAETITFASEQIGQHAAGPIVAVSFAGRFTFLGSEGNPSAVEMIDYLRSVLVATNAAAVPLDFRSLQYHMG